MILHRIKSCWLLLIVLASSALMAQGAPRQELLDIEITISLKEVTLKQALTELESVANVKFVYSRSYLNLDEKVTIEAMHKKLGQILSELLSPLEIRFAVQDAGNFVVLTQSKQRGMTEPVGDPPASKFSVTVAGKITDAAGQPMAGVNVVEKGTTNGTSTDADGNYTLETGDDPVLVFSFIGYRTIEERVNGRTVIDLAMLEDRSMLDQVLVNAGYWKTTEREQTGSISRVTAEEIQRQPVNNPLAAMIGRMPGVNIQQNSGLPGSGFTVQIRGRNSLRFDANTPMYIVDGVPISTNSITSGFSPLGASNPLVGFNPADIESIEVLKDADATAIYGTRGANGVILITTKKGLAGKTKMDLNVSTGVGKVGRFMELLNSEQYMMMRHEAFRNDGLEPGPEDFDLIGVWDTTRYTDWQKTLIGGTAKQTSAQLSMSGGTANTSFSFGGGLYKETSVMPGDFGNRKINTRLGLNHRSDNKKFELSFQSTFVNDKNTLPFTDLTSTALNLPPVAPRLYNEDGTINWADGTWPLQFNPIAYTLIEFKAITQNLISSTQLSYELLPGLKIKTNLGYTATFLNEETSTPIEANDPAWGVTTGFTDFSSNTSNSWIVEPQLEYRRRLGEGFITALVGSTFQESVRKGQTLRAAGFTNNIFLDNIRAATTITVLSTAYTQYKYNAFFGRLNYSLRDKYFINLTGRRDGSTRFGPGNQFSNFGAAAVGWLFKEEEFMKGLTFLSFGKLRTSYGITGNDQIPDYGFLDAYQPTQYPYQGRSGLVPSRLANPSYSWETTKKAEISMDLGFFHDRIFLTSTYYQNRSSNQLVGYSLPRITGFATVQYNLPALVQNTGLELMLRTSNVDRKSFRWNSTFTLTVPRNKLISYPNLENSSDANRWTIGKPLTTPKTLHYTGVDPQTGIYTFEDLNGNGNGTDSPGDLVATKFVGQKWFGGIDNHFQYKGFSLDVFIQFVEQTSGNYITAQTMFYTPGIRGNQPVEVLDRWQKPGDLTNVQKFTVSNDGIMGNVAASMGDGVIVNSSFVRIKNVSFNYDFPQRLISGKLHGARLYFQSQNLFTFSDFSSIDPEQSYMELTPSLRFFSAGIQLTI